MNRTLQLEQDRAARIEAARTILEKANTEKRALTTEEQSAFDSATAEAEQINATLDRERKLAAMSNIHSDAPAVQTRGRQVESVRDLSLEKPFTSFGEQLMAIKHAEMVRSSGTSAAIDNRLFEIQKRAASGSSEAVPADGGFLIQPDFSTEILSLAHDAAQVYNRTRKIPLSDNTNAIKIPGIDEQSRADGSRWGGVQMYWQNEAGSLTGTKPKFRNVELTTKKLTGLYYATDELLQDARALGSIVMQAFGEELGFKVDDACVRGTGSGQPLGVLNAGCKVQVAKESGQASSTITYNNVKAMWKRMWARSRANAVWFINQDCEDQLYSMSQAVGTAGAPVFLPPGGASDAPYSRLFGRPVIPIEQCDTVGTEGDILLADFSQYVTVDKGEMQSAVSMHVRFLNDEQTFRWIYRVDGQPIWHTALTPFKGANTLSPFISLQSR